MTELLPITISINTQEKNPLQLDFSNPIVITDLLSCNLDYKNYNSEFGNNLEVVSNDDLFGIIDINDPRYSFKVYLPQNFGGYLSFDICTTIDGVRHPDLNAGMLMQTAINFYLKKLSIVGISANWGEIYNNPSTNLLSYNLARASGMSLLESAKQTWTGKQASKANMIPTKVIEKEEEGYVICFFTLDS